jgi:hypothetical protein
VISQTKKKKGGKRTGSGRKKNQARVAVEAAATASLDLDGRSVGGKAHAQWLIEELNKIDPAVMEHLDLIVSADPYEVPTEASEKERSELQKMEAQRKLAWRAREIAQRKFSRLSYELQGWARIWFDSRFKLDARKYLHDKAGHQAVRIINHVHDKPIEHNVNLNLSERFRLAMQKAEDRVRSLR